MIVVSHWSKPAWQNMASLLAVVVGYRTPHSMPYGGKFHHLIFKKPPLVRAPARGMGRACWAAELLRDVSGALAVHGADSRRVNALPPSSDAAAHVLLCT